MIWKILNNKTGEKKTVGLIGECYIYLNDLLNMKSQITNVDNLYQKTVQIEKVLWHDGKNLGTVQSVISIKYEPHIQQLFAGVMTDKGLKKAAPLILSSNKKMEKNKYIIELNECLTKITQQNSRYKENNFQPENQELNYANFIVKDLIDKTTKILLKTEKQSSISFVYSTVEQMLKMQELFLDIADALWLKFDSMQGELETAYCQCFEALLKRGEFDLENIGIEVGEKNIFDAKIKVGQRYQRFLFETLSYVFDQLENRAISSSKRNLVEFYLAYCYFRIPDFRYELLAVLSDDSGDMRATSGNKAIKTVLFSWKEDFYSPLEQFSPNYHSNHSILTESLKKGWRLKFKSRGIIFFYFVKEWCSYVKKSIVVNNIEWEHIPGYNTLVENFLSQIKNREVSKYPDILLESSLLMLGNPKLLKIFFLNILEKTKFDN